jgi:hypothetical protein
VCPARCNLSRDWALKIGTEKLNYREDFFMKFKGTLSREEHKTGISCFTTIEMNLLVEFTDLANDGLCTFNLKKPGTTSYELKAMSYEL